MPIIPKQSVYADVNNNSSECADVNNNSSECADVNNNSKSDSRKVTTK